MKELVPQEPTPRWLRWFAPIALAVYAVFLGRYTVVVAGGSDSSGYLNSARLLAAGELVTELRAPLEFGPRAALDAMHFLPQGFFPYRTGGYFTPTYPTGLPLHFAAAGKLLGWEIGPFVVLLLAALAAVCLCYAVARELGLSPAISLAGAALLAAFPVFIFTSVQPLSDTLATTWTLAALLAALRAGRFSSAASWCGFALGVAVLVRPTNTLLAPALIVLLGFNLKKLALFIIGGLPCAGWLAWYNHHLYGSALRSGYGDNVFSAFGLQYGAPTAVHFAKWLALLLPTVVLALPFFALGHRFTRTGKLAGLLLAFATITGVYAFYEVSHEVWWCLRFILPAVAALILAALLGVEALAQSELLHRRKIFRTTAAVILGVWAVASSWYWTPRLDVLRIKQYETAYRVGSLRAQAELPRDAVLVSFAFSGALYFYTDFPVMRWDQMEAPAFSTYAEKARLARRPVCAVLFDWEEKDAFRRCPGEWKRVATVGNVGLWQLSLPAS